LGFLRPKVDELEEDVWFQQDGVTAHTSRRLLSIGHLISLRGDIGWSARSPDLTPCDFFLWGYLKAKVYACHPGTIEQLKEATTTRSRRHSARDDPQSHRQLP